MGKVDRNEAPEGYVAKRYDGKKGYKCKDCAFAIHNCVDHLDNCRAENRKDGQPVIFVKKP